MIFVGIDPGVTTGFAVWDDHACKLIEVRSLKLHEAMAKLVEVKPDFVVFEDARQRTWFGGRDRNQKKFGAGVREGAGSVKRDCTIWEEYLSSLGLNFAAKGPSARATKWEAQKFEQQTGWEGRTSEHARDAAVLVIGLTPAKFELLKTQAEVRVKTLKRTRTNRKRRRQQSAAVRHAFGVTGSDGTADLGQQGSEEKVA